MTPEPSDAPPDPIAADPFDARARRVASGVLLGIAWNAVVVAALAVVLQLRLREPEESFAVIWGTVASVVVPILWLRSRRGDDVARGFCLVYLTAWLAGLGLLAWRLFF